MLLYLLISVGACACFVEGKAPQYFETKKNLEQVLTDLGKDLLSMNVHKMPLLNDGRRHFAMFWHVVYKIAASEYIIIPDKQDQIYYFEAINVWAPEALANPTLVVYEVTDFIKEFKNKTENIVSLINSVCITSKFSMHNQVEEVTCDDLVQEKIKPGTELAKEADVFMSSSHVARVFLEMHSELMSISNSYRALEYIIKGDIPLKLIEPLVDLLLKMRPRNGS